MNPGIVAAIVIALLLASLAADRKSRKAPIKDRAIWQTMGAVLAGGAAVITFAMTYTLVVTR